MQTTLHVSVVDGVPAAWAAIEPASSPAADAYGLAAKALGALFTTLPIDGFQAPLATSSANAWLPTRKGVVAPLADAGGSPIASLTWPQTVALLSESRGRETFGNDIRIGCDLAALGRVLRLAFELVAGKHVLPGLVLDAPKLVPRARWQPVLGAPERAICAAIAAVLTPVVGALSTADSTTAPRFDRTLQLAIARPRGARTRGRGGMRVIS